MDVPRRVTEDEIQAAAFAWLNLLRATVVINGKSRSVRVGDYAWHVPNGIWLPSSDRVLAAKVMSKLRSRGLKKGVSDITIALPVGRWHGGYFELKRPKDGRLTQEQRKFLDRMADVGYFTAECVGLDAFQKSVTEFLASGKEA